MFALDPLPPEAIESPHPEVVPYIDDENLIGSNVAEPYRRGLCESLALDLAGDRKSIQSAINKTGG